MNRVRNRLQASESTKESTSTGDSIGMDSSVKTAGLRVSRQPSVRTTPLAYMPQALGFTLARILGLNSIALLYLGRFFNLLLFAAVGALTIKQAAFWQKCIFWCIHFTNEPSSGGLFIL